MNLCKGKYQMTGLNTIDIKISLLKQNVTQAQIARDLGVSIVMVNRVIHGLSRSKKVEAYIQSIVNKAPDKT